MALGVAIKERGKKDSVAQRARPKMNVPWSRIGGEQHPVCQGLA